MILWPRFSALSTIQFQFLISSLCRASEKDCHWDKHLQFRKEENDDSDRKDGEKDWKRGWGKLIDIWLKYERTRILETWAHQIGSLVNSVMLSSVFPIFRIRLLHQSVFLSIARLLFRLEGNAFEVRFFINPTLQYALKHRKYRYKIFSKI